MILALPELLWFALILFSFAVVYVCRKFIEALFQPIIGAVGHIPGLGGAIGGALHSVEQSLSNALGTVENKLDALMGASFHKMAEASNWLWREIKSHAHVIALISPLVAELFNIYAALHRLVHELTKGAHSVTSLIKTLTKEYHGIEHRVKTIERELARGIGNDVRTRVKALERALTRVEDKVIPAIESGVATAENDVTALQKWIAQNVPLIGTTALVGAVAWALSRLGLGGLRCNSLTNALGRRGCGLWSGLDDLLGLFVDALLLSNICALLPTLEGLVSDVADPLVVGLTDVGAGLCSGGIGPAPLLAVPALSLPANPGVTLNLP